MAKLEIIALDTVNTDADGRFILRAPGSGDSYLAPRPVHFDEHFTVSGPAQIPNLNASLLEGRPASDFATQADINAILPGLKGKDGQIRYTGSGPPGTIIGASPDDTYLDLDSGNIYKLG